MTLPIPLFILWVAVLSPSAVPLVVLTGTLAVVARLLLVRRVPSPGLWDRSTLSIVGPGPWYANLWFRWCVLSAILVGIYARFW